MTEFKNQPSSENDKRSNLPVTDSFGLAGVRFSDLIRRGVSMVRSTLSAVQFL